MVGCLSPFLMESGELFLQGGGGSGCLFLGSAEGVFWENILGWYQMFLSKYSYGQEYVKCKLLSKF